MVSDRAARVGLYGVIAAIAVPRPPEIGMRMALGATRRFKSLLVGVSATDSVSFAGTTALLVLVALVATYLPPRRAAGIDPLQALGNE